MPLPAMRDAFLAGLAFGFILGLMFTLLVRAMFHG